MTNAEICAIIYTSKKRSDSMEINYTNVIDVSYSEEFISHVKSLKENTQPVKPKKLSNPEEEHDAEPIKNKEDIARLRDYFLHHNLRNHMLFVVGINVGLRISDLLSLRFRDVMNDDLSYKKEIVKIEQKTRNTSKKIKRRIFSLSPVAIQAIEMYRQTIKNFSLDLYLFRSESPATKYTYTNKHMTRQGAQDVLNEAFDALGITTRHGTHVLRKTFAYHVLTGTNDPFERARRLELLQSLFNHSSPAVTLAYAGISRDEKVSLYQNLDLGIDCIDLSLGA